MDAAHSRPRLGELLVEEGFLSEDQLAAALAEQQQTGRRLGEIIVARGFMSGPALANALADQHGSLVRTEYGIGTGFRRRRESDAADLDPLEAALRDKERELRRANALLAAQARELEALRSELDRAQRELAEAEHYVLAAPVDGRYVTLLCAGEAPAAGAPVKLPGREGQLFVATAHRRVPCLFLEPYAA